MQVDNGQVEPAGSNAAHQQCWCVRGHEREIFQLKETIELAGVFGIIWGERGFKLQISLTSLFSCFLIHRFSLSLCLSTDATRWCLGCCLISTQTFPCKQLHTDIPAEWICEGKCTEAGMIWWQNRAGVRAEWEEKLERMTVKINFGIKEWEERDKRWNGISGKDTKVHVKTDQAWCRLEKQEIRQLTSLGLLSYLHPPQLSLLNRYVSEKEAYGEKQTNRRVQEKISVWRLSITYRDKSTRRRKKGCSVCP